MTEKKTSRPTSSRQVAANQANAASSTGPRTPDGKARAAQNASRTGVWASSIRPIRNGPFKEDPEELEATIAATVEAFEPRDELERVQAFQVAGLRLRLGRLDRVADTALDESGRHDRGIESMIPMSNLYYGSQLLEWVRRGMNDEPDLQASNLAEWYVKYDGGGISVVGLWDDEHTPDHDDTATWTAILRALIENLGATTPPIPVLERLVDTFTYATWDVPQIVDSMIATMDRTSTIRARLLKSFERELGVMNMLKRRDLVDPSP